jgi:hypothetical protein
MSGGLGAARNALGNNGGPQSARSPVELGFAGNRTRAISQNVPYNARREDFEPSLICL